jgi:uncharacterized membrane protein
LARPLIESLAGRAVPGAGFVTTVAVVFLAGFLYLGDVVVLPAEDVIDTDLSVEEGVSLMLSAGASMPRVVRER